MIESIVIVLQFIVDSDYERNDFQQNPTTDHVYYHAVRALKGEQAADNAYSLACGELMRTK